MVTHPSTLLRNAIVVLLVTGLSFELSAQALVPNLDFKDGADGPTGWQQVGAGRWIDRDVIEVSGNGNDSSYWMCDKVEFQPGKLYRFAVRARRVGGSGSAITGPTFANRDQQSLTDKWQWIGHVFRTPDDPSGFLRVGQWHATGAIQFDGVQLQPAVAVHTVQHGLELGEGEIIRDGEYSFLGSFSHEGSNDHRPLVSATAGFNSDRWVFGADQQVTYRFDLPGYEFLSGDVQFNVNYFTRGSCVAEVSHDGKTWQELVTKDGLGAASARLPDGLMPAPRFWLRLRASVASYFQVNQIDFRAKPLRDTQKHQRIRH